MPKGPSVNVGSDCAFRLSEALAIALRPVESFRFRRGRDETATDHRAICIWLSNPRSSKAVFDTRHDVARSAVHAVVAGIAEVLAVENVVQVDRRTEAVTEARQMRLSII